MLRVMVMEAWPSISETTFTLTPSLKEQGGARVPEIVETQILPHAGALPLCA